MPVPTLPAWPAGRPLRSWQQEAVEAVLAHPRQLLPRLRHARPRARRRSASTSRTGCSPRAASRRVVRGRADHPHRRQWAADAARYGIDLEPNRPNAAGPGAARPPRRRGHLPDARRRAGRSTAAAATRLPTLLIADEPHHMGEQAAWGRSAQAAFEGARFRLLLSGTPFRSDNTPIPWVTYDDDGVSASDYAYGYTDALLDGVCRPVTFHTYDGDMEWMSDGRRRRADFSVGAAARPRPRGGCAPRSTPRATGWRSVLRDADARLTDLRAGPHPEAGGLVVAIDKEHAERSPTGSARVSGERPEIVTSETPGASERIARFAAGSGALARVGADGLRGRRRPAAARRRLRDDGAHRAVLPPGRRALRPPHARRRASR